MPDVESVTKLAIVLQDIETAVKQLPKEIQQLLAYS